MPASNLDQASCLEYAMALLHVITFLIHAITAAFASLLMAVFAHLVPALIAVLVLAAVLLSVCASCGVGGVAFLRRRGRSDG